MDLPAVAVATARAPTKTKRLNFIIAIASVRGDGSTLETTMLDEEWNLLRTGSYSVSSGSEAKVSDPIRLHLEHSD